MNYKKKQKSLISQQWGTKMIKKVTQYIKYYLEPDSKTIRKMAFDSAKEYYSGKRKTAIEFQSYQKGYVGAYRHTYAKTKITTI